ncbi:hypothetical protein Nm8I071_22350 [Nonomuraea sp. TT08I-71]|nr:hypothetical protein Nm8I071_22350 [Nonomuraea sp. TT08I-71]
MRDPHALTEAPDRADAAAGVELPRNAKARKRAWPEVLGLGVCRDRHKPIPNPVCAFSVPSDAGQHALTTAGRHFLSAQATVEAALPRPASDVQQALRDLHAAIGAAAQRA